MTVPNGIIMSDRIEITIPATRAQGRRRIRPMPMITLGTETAMRHVTSAMPVIPMIGSAIRASGSPLAPTALVTPPNTKTRISAANRPNAPNAICSEPSTLTCVSMDPPCQAFYPSAGPYVRHRLCSYTAVGGQHDRADGLARAAVARRSAGVAVQSRMGILPKRRIRADPYHSDRAGAGREIVTRASQKSESTKTGLFSDFVLLTYMRQIAVLRPASSSRPPFPHALQGLSAASTSILRITSYCRAATPFRACPERATGCARVEGSLLCATTMSSFGTTVMYWPPMPHAVNAPASGSDASSGSHTHHR